MFGRKNGCRYFIDSENVNEVWVNILNILKPEDHIFLFYTDNSAHISCARAVELINIGAKQITGIRCKEGNNGLDFQMVTQLGAVISKSPKCEYILVSNDNGFDAVVSYWKQKGYNIRREKSSFCVSLQISDPDKPSAAQKKNANTNRRQSSNQRYQSRPRLENKKDYKKQTPKLEDKTQQPAGSKTYNNKPHENKTYDKTYENKTRENRTYENKAYDNKANDSRTSGSKQAAGKYAGNSKAPDDKEPKDRASDNQKVVDLEAKKAKKIEEKRRQEKAREAEAEKKNGAVAASDEEAFAQDVTAAEAAGEEAVMEAEAAQAEATMEAETVQAEAAMEAETVQAETAVENEAGRTAPMMEDEPTQDGTEAAQEHDDFEPMEKPMAIPDTAMVADGTGTIDTRYCLQSLCTMISRKNMALFHNALTCIFEQKDGDEIYAAVKSHPELHTQLWSRYEQDREERVRGYLRLLLDVNDCEVQDTDLLYQVYRETYDGSLQGLNIGIMKAFGDETGVKYYRLLRKHINILTKL